ncbi:MAG: complex I NDUFA9 subunit family protein [Proteobacteria bacterium]|jgi:NADH dehydrogenase|uniref:Complex I NDUFA9 subunit family protein n=1 Tax=Candidatus Fonsibacter lacus TaxID=2576439 RepID=A0A966HU26_9PROT|nr:complex I NDUFA9 subunit family protein [Candidatus Fonsibacter lacus]NBV39667.1 complex I NDUFA9 subunit family protein [Candidatus Fonsibacter lacus]NCU53037.1 complex I NDUFA9 subunit family protein [Candidatus Fonsibacter lacus]
MAEKKTITVFGGTGFIGRNLIGKLAKKGFKIVVPTRNPYLHGYLKPMGEPGQIEVLKFNPFDFSNLNEFIKSSEIVINCIGVLYEKKNQKFDHVHHLFPKFLSSILDKGVTKKFIHISALGANKNSNSLYIKSKFQGEEAVMHNFKNSIIVRPSIVFGTNDSFFNLFNKLINILPIIPLAGSKTKFQPCYVGDVTDAIIKIIEQVNLNSIYELGGPKIYTFKELIETLLVSLKKKRLIVELPDFVARVQAKVMQLFPNPLLTEDQLEILKSDNVCSNQYPGFKELGISTRTVEIILPNYIFSQVIR